MSRFTQAAATMHTLSLAAMEEASRLGVRDADIEHLLLALTIDPDTGGQVLRGAGVGLDLVREAVAEQHARQLRAVGIDAAPAGPGRIVFHETSGYEWTDRALNVLKVASTGVRRGDSAAVLRALLDEPSGMIEAVLRRIGADPERLRSRLDELADLANVDQGGSHDSLTGFRSMFIPAPIDDVWALLSSPDRIPEWDQNLASIAQSSADPGTWEARARTTTPDGRPTRVKDALLRQHVTAVRTEEPVAISWRFVHPDVDRSNPRVLDFALEHAAGGTQVGVTLTWQTTRRRRGPRIARAPLRPLHRFVIFLQLVQVESGVSRVFR